MHIVKNFEERDPGKNVGHAIIAVPPKNNAGDEERELHRVRPFPRHPHSRKIYQE